MDEPLIDKKCVVCNDNVSQVNDSEQLLLIKQIPKWDVQVNNNVKMLVREYQFKNYKLAWEFANKVAALAEFEFHHPAILLEWGKVKVTWWTHTVNGLHKNDFICAAKTDQLQ